MELKLVCQFLICCCLYAFNRTAYGIEIIESICPHIICWLLIAPLMELKLMSEDLPRPCLLPFNRTAYGIEIYFYARLNH